jgi:hypothetical protein
MFPLPFTLGKDKSDLSLREKLALLGPDAIPLIIPYGSKGKLIPGSPWNRYMKGWDQRTLADTQTKEYQEDLYCDIPKNIAIRQGGGLTQICAWDFDFEEGKVIEEFMAANPFMRHTIMTVGNRGFTAWIRIAGPYPERNHIVTAHDKYKLEWRGNGYSIIQGKHPEGNQYRFFTFGQEEGLIRAKLS